MSKLRRKSPCHDCPWRRNARAGWLGNDKPADFLVKTYYGEGDMPCHTEIDYSDPAWRETQLPDSAYCAGGLQFLNNVMKMPRDPDMVAACDAVGRNPAVFGWPTEFLSHHLGRTIDQLECHQLMTEALDRMEEQP